MKDLKIGQILKGKNGYGYGDMRIVSIGEDGMFLFDEDEEVIWVENESIKKYFIIPEEKWEPKRDDTYWFIDYDGYIKESYWTDNGSDNIRKNFLGVYQTKEKAEEALKIIKEKLKSL